MKSKCVIVYFAISLLLFVSQCQECEKGVSAVECFKERPICNQNSPTQSMANLPVGPDTLGVLLANQWLWRLPGIDHMAHGFHVFKGQKSNYPIFLFCYPNKTESTVRLQDTYRGNTYILPNYVFASALPQCVFSMDSKHYSSAQDFALSMAVSVGIAQENNVEAQLTRKLSANAHSIFELDASISTALSTQQKKSGSLFVTTAECSTTSVQLNHRDITSFHPEFIADLIETKLEDMPTLVDKYGTHYFQGAVLGGKLVQISVTSNEHQNTMSKLDIDTKLHAGFGGGGTLGKFSAYSNNDISASLSMELESQLEFESNTARSSIISYGGTPGSFGTDGDISSWGEWAKSVDLIPVPIRYSLGDISDLIPSNWDDGSMKIKTKWEMGVANYLTHRKKFKKLVVKATYLFFITTGSINDRVGPYGIKLYDGNSQPHTLFLFEEDIQLGQTQFVKFTTKKKYTFSRQDAQIPGFDGSIAICNAAGISGGVLSGNVLGDFKIENFTIVDRFTGLAYQYAPVLSNTAECQDIQPIVPKDQIVLILTSTCNGTCHSSVADAVVRVTLTGTEGTISSKIALDTIRPASGQDRFHAQLDVSGIKKSRSIDIGSIKKIEMAIYWTGSLDTALMEDIRIDGSSFYVQHCSNQRCHLLKASTAASTRLSPETKVTMGLERI